MHHTCGLLVCEWFSSLCVQSCPTALCVVPARDLSAVACAGVRDGVVTIVRGHQGGLGSYEKGWFPGALRWSPRVALLDPRTQGWGQPRSHAAVSSRPHRALAAPSLVSWSLGVCVKVCAAAPAVVSTCILPGAPPVTPFPCFPAGAPALPRSARRGARPSPGPCPSDG